MSKKGFKYDPATPLFTPEQMAYFAPAPASETAEQGRGIFRTVGDVATKAVAGVPKAAAAVAGIGSLVPGVHYLADPLASGLNATGDWIGDKLLSDEQKRQDAELAEVMARNEGFVDSAGAALSHIKDNPLQGAMMFAESVPSIVAGGFLGQGVKRAGQALGLKRTGGMSATAAGAVGEGLIGGGSVAGQIATENPDDFAARYWAVPAGVVTGAVGGVGGRIMGGSDIDTLAAQAFSRETAEGLAARQPVDLLRKASSTPARVGKGIVGESAEEFIQSGQETAFTNIGTEKDWDQGVGAAGVMGAYAGSHMGAAGGLRRGANTYTDPELASFAAILDDKTADPAARVEAADFIRRTKMTNPEEAEAWHDNTMQQIVADAEAATAAQEAAKAEADAEEAARQKQDADMVVASKLHPLGQFEKVWKETEKRNKAALDAKVAEYKQAYALVNPQGVSLDDYIKERMQQEPPAQGGTLLDSIWHDLRNQEGAKNKQGRLITAYRAFLQAKTGELASGARAADDFAVEQQLGEPPTDPTTPIQATIEGAVGTAPTPERDGAADMLAAIEDTRRQRRFDKAPYATEDMFTGDLTTNYPAVEQAEASPAAPVPKEQTSFRSMGMPEANENADIPNTEFRGPKTLDARLDREVADIMAREGIVTIRPAGREALKAALYSHHIGALPIEKFREVIAAVRDNSTKTSQRFFTGLIENAVRQSQKGTPTFKVADSAAPGGELHLTEYEIRSRLEVLEPRDRAILADLLGEDSAEPLTPAQIAKKHGVNKATVSRVLGSLGGNAKLLKKALASSGMSPVRLGQLQENILEEGASGTPLRVVDSPASLNNDGPTDAIDTLPADKAPALNPALSPEAAERVKKLLAKKRAESDAAVAAKQAEAAKVEAEKAREAARREAVERIEMKRTRQKVIDSDAVQAAAGLAWSESTEFGDPAWKDLGGLKSFWTSRLLDLLAEDPAPASTKLNTVFLHLEGRYDLRAEVVEKYERNKRAPNARTDRGTVRPGTEDGATGQPGTGERRDEAAFSRAREAEAERQRAGRRDITESGSAARQQNRLALDLLGRIDALQDELSARNTTSDKEAVQQEIDALQAQYDALLAPGTGGTDVGPVAKNRFNEQLPQGEAVTTTNKKPVETGVDKVAPPSADRFGPASRPVARKVAVTENALKSIPARLEAVDKQIAGLAPQIIERGTGSRTKAMLDLKKEMAELKAKRQTILDQQSFYQQELGTLKAELDAAREQDAEEFRRKDDAARWMEAEEQNTPEETREPAKTATVDRVIGTAFDTGTMEDPDAPGARKFSTGAAQGQPATAVRSTLAKAFRSPYFMNRAVEVVQAATDLPPGATKGLSSTEAQAVRGVFFNGKAYLVANNIPGGKELGVLLHEVGVHMGMKNLLGQANYDKLLKQLEAWEKQGYGPAMPFLRAARARMAAAAELTGETQPIEELLAYFVEEAVNQGVNPTAVKGGGQLQQWFRTLWAAVTKALAKLGIDTSLLTPQDVVDLAYGAAQIELQGEQLVATGVGAGNIVAQGANPESRMFSIAAPGSAASVLTSVADYASGPVAGTKRLSFGAMPLDWMEKITGSAAVAQYRGVLTRMQADAEKRVYEAAKVDAKFDEVAKNPLARDELYRLMRETTLARFDPTKDTPTTPEQIALKERFDTLEKASPKATELYKEVRDYYEANDKARLDIMKKMAKAAGKGKGDALDRMAAKMKGPYFPLKRLGTWYITGMSAELAALNKIERPTSAESKQIKKLQADEKHYWTSTHDSKREALQQMRAIQSRYAVMEAPKPVAEDVLNDIAATSPDLMRVRDYLVAGLPDEAKGRAASLLAEMYYDMLPEHHYLKSRLKRIGVAGANEDMRRVFAHTSINQAHYISRMEHSPALSEAMVAVRKAGRDGGETERMLENELAKRGALAFERELTPGVNRLLTASYLAHLGLSLAFLLTNLTQVPMISMPWLAGRFGVRAATGAMGGAIVDASKLISTSLRTNGFWTAELDWKGKLKNAGEERLIETLIDRKLIDGMTEHELNAIAEMRSPTAAKLMRMANMPVRVTELANRTSVALATYRLAMARNANTDAAIEFAARAVEETQYNYSNLNAPRYMQSIFGSRAAARIMSQFRKYQINTLILLAKAMYDAVQKAPTEEQKVLRSEARKTLYGIFVMSGLFAGALGMPFVGNAMWLATFLAGFGGEEDEPWDAETAFKNWLVEITEDPEVARLIAFGAPTALDMNLSVRIGHGQIASPLPFMRSGRTVEATAANVLLNMAGAPIGTVVDTVDGMQKMADGDMLKGIEKFFPLKLVKDLFRGYRMSTEGMTTSKGEDIKPAEAFDVWDITQRTMGFSPESEVLYYDANEVVQRQKEAVAGVRRGLLRRYAQAVIRGEPVEEIMEEIGEFGLRHPDNKIDYTSRRRAVKERRRAAAERNGAGVRIDTSTAAFEEDIAFAE